MGYKAKRWRHADRASHVRTRLLYVNFTGAADVEANGYTNNDVKNTGSVINTNGTDITRAAEGVIDITFWQAFPEILQVCIKTLYTTYTVHWDGTSVATTNINKVRLIVLDSAGNPADPDGEQLRGHIVIKESTG